jgi:hypothetical protein
MKSIKIADKAALQINFMVLTTTHYLNGVRDSMGLPDTASFNQKTMSFEIPEEEKKE